MHWSLLAACCLPLGGTGPEGSLRARFGAPPAARAEERPEGLAQDPASWPAACEDGVAVACKDHGIVLRRADRTDEAHGWLEKGCALGSGMACSHRAYGDLRTDPAAALAWWEQGCSAGYDKSCHEAAVEHEELGDLERAAARYAHACLMGYSVGCQALVRLRSELELAPELAAWAACRECTLQHERMRPDANQDPDGPPPCLALENLGTEAAATCPVSPGAASAR